MSLNQQQQQPLDHHQLQQQHPLNQPLINQQIHPMNQLTLQFTTHLTIHTSNHQVPFVRDSNLIEMSALQAARAAGSAPKVSTTKPISTSQWPANLK